MQMSYASGYFISVHVLRALRTERAAFVLEIYNIADNVRPRSSIASAGFYDTVSSATKKEMTEKLTCLPPMLVEFEGPLSDSSVDASSSFASSC